jgi:hypothetical protein
MLTNNVQARTYRSGQWVVIECLQGIEPSSASILRNVMDVARDPSWTGAVLDLGLTGQIDPNGRKMLINFQHALSNVGKTLTLVVEVESLRNLLQSDEQFLLLANMSELRRSIHEMSLERQKHLEESGIHNSNLLSFKLCCPLCRSDLVKGWMPAPGMHIREWMPNEVTPQLVRDDGHTESLDVETYTPAVCPECLFAATRLDWFDIPSLDLRTTLSDTALDRLVKTSQRRRILLSSEKIEEDMSLFTFFGMPRLPQAAAFAWALAADSIQVVGKERAAVDSLGVAMSHIMGARFAREGKSLEKHYTAAYIWLKTSLDHSENYAEERMIEASVYLVSICLAMGRDHEAKEVFKKAKQKWGGHAEYSFWLGRSESLLKV